MPWNLSNDGPIYLQLIRHIKLLILSGRYECGEHFPAVRELAAEASVNPNTMQKALTVLEQEGLLINNRTTGRTVTSDQSMIDETRNQMAKDILTQCRQSLQQLGFSAAEAKDLIMKEEL